MMEIFDKNGNLIGDIDESILSNFKKVEIRPDGNTYKGDALINAEYTFKGDDYIYESASGSEVMGKWETPLMERYAEIVNHNSGDILEIGYGLGLFANKCYSLGVKSYTIVEFHPQVLERLKIWAEDKPEVTVISGDWAKNLEEIKSKKYDSIFFDTHMDDNRPYFRELVVNDCIKEDGIFAYFTMGDEDTFKYGLNLKQENVTVRPGLKSWFSCIEGQLPASYIKYPLR